MGTADSALKAAWELIRAGRPTEARAMCAEALEHDPELVEAEFALGVALFRLGDKEGALFHLSGYVDAAPEAVEALGLTAQLHLEFGQGDRALELARRAYELRPDEGPVLLLHLSGKNFLAKDLPLSALRAFQELIRLSPKQPAGYLGAGEAYEALGSSFDAAEMYGAAVGLAPRKSTLMSLGTLELKIGRPERALHAVQTILNQNPADPHANMLAGQSLIEQDLIEESERYWSAAADSFARDLRRGASTSMMGHFEEGERHLRQSIAAEPRQGSAYQMIFANRRAKEEDAKLVGQMEDVFHEGNLGAAEGAALAFALGKAWDDLGEPGKGFGYYDKGHEIQRGMLKAPFDPANAIEQFRAQKLLFSDSRGDSADNGVPPILVVGMLRSGTTLTEQILSAHSRVKGAGELDFWTASEPLMIDRQTPAFQSDAGAERRSAYRRLLDSFGGKNLRIVDKFPGNLNLVGVIHHLFPAAHIISLRRNPIDIAISIWGTYSNPFSPFTVSRDSVVFAVRHAGEVADYWASVLPADRFLDSRYESLVSSPEEEIRKILEFCELPWEGGCLHAHESKTKVRTPSLSQVRQPVYTSSIDRWKRYEPWLGEFRALLASNRPSQVKK